MGATLLISAPNSPAAPAVAKAATKNQITARRTVGSEASRSPYIMTTAAATVAAIGAIQPTCSFHSIPNSCQSLVLSPDSSKERGYSLRSVSPSGGAARYQGYTM